MTVIETKIWDPAEHLDSEEKIALYLDAAFEDGDAAVIAAALGDVSRAKGMSQVARDAGVSRENLYRALSAEGHPEFATVMKVIKALGYDLAIRQRPAEV
ncbi:addiction module antidote protein [Rhizobium sp. C4]|uniref:addiction module antidote protein n=1 Tax=Rhizobium sp. C4 TaxID=1349800 RepID=UPI001E3572E6|nr:addiction module antidote protein [Rhizobium sp. C4]MCD2171965.1 putative addiction module antidote protein [Rhizobium sp. C4]